MSEIDCLIAGFCGGCIGGLAIAMGVVVNLKRIYDQRIMMMRMQIIGLQTQMGIVNDD